MSALQQIIDEDIEIDPGEETEKRSFAFNSIIKYSIAASVLIAVGFSIYFLSLAPAEKVLLTEQVEEKELKTAESIIDTVQSEKITLEKTDELIKDEIENNQELYAVNIVLENFIERKVRAENKVSILSPKAGVKVTFPVRFEFEFSDPNNIAEIIIVNNKNETVISEEIDGTVFLLKNELKKGLYYWKVKVDGKVEAISKFSI